MNVKFARIAVRTLSIRMMVVLWACSVLLAWSGLVGGWFTAKGRLTRIDERITLDARALDAAHMMESDVLAERYEDLLWKVTGQDRYKQERDRDLKAAEEIADDLGPYITTEQERQTAVQIDEEMDTLIEQSESPALDPSQSEPLMAKLLSAVRLFDTQNESDLQASLHAAEQLDREVTDWAIALSLATAGLLLTGSFSLISRVVRPALALTNSARDFGQGNLAARATVLHDDELGSLVRTFNNMADDIAHREQDRLRFVAMVVHDLKNPALAIDLGARMLRESWGKEQTAGEADTASLLDAMSEEATRLRTIVRDLTDDIQVATGRFSIRRTKVDLCSLVQRLIRSQAQAFADHRIVVEDDPACAVLGDPDRLERVVQNLVSNAVKYSPHGTQVTVRIRKKEPLVILAVIDQGQGISPEDLKVLFQPFGRGRSAERLAEGAGMGLYVVKQIVEAHGGQITVESELGRGTTFEIQLPLA